MSLDKNLFDKLIETGRQKEWKEMKEEQSENQYLNRLLHENKATYEQIKDAGGKVVREIVKDLDGKIIYDEIPQDRQKLVGERFSKDIAKSSDKRANN